MKQPKILKSLWGIYFEIAGKVVATVDSQDQQGGSGVAWKCDHCPERMLEQESIQGSR